MVAVLVTIVTLWLIVSISYLGISFIDTPRYRISKLQFILNFPATLIVLPFYGYFYYKNQHLRSQYKEAFRLVPLKYSGYEINFYISVLETEGQGYFDSPFHIYGSTYFLDKVLRQERQEDFYVSPIRELVERTKYSVKLQKLLDEELKNEFK